MLYYKLVCDFSSLQCSHNLNTDSIAAIEVILRIVICCRLIYDLVLKRLLGACTYAIAQREVFSISAYREQRVLEASRSTNVLY